MVKLKGGERVSDKQSSDKLGGAASDGWMDPIGNQHLDLGNEQSPHRGGRRIPRR